MRQPDPTVEINYTLHPADGSITYESVRAGQVPRVGELVAVGPRDSYEVVDVLWHVNDGQQHVTITACERDWHQHIQDTLQRWRGTSLDPAETRHLVELLGFIDWSSDLQSEDSTDSAIPKELNQTLDQDRWIMLQNALLDWDIVRTSEPGADGDAVWRLAVVYVLPVFEGMPAEADWVLGELVSTGTHLLCESPGALEGLGRRWREDLCATAWRIQLADQAQKPTKHT